MRYGSVCSGIEAASVAWHPLGWQGAFLSEIEPFPRAVLAHHWGSIPLHGDFTTIRAGQYESIELLVGGTPCQSFSVAGLRGGLADDRGNLALQFLKLAHRLRPRWVVWENVPGVLSSNGGRDFGAILGGLGELGYGWAYRVLDAQYFGVPQRRRRVFVVGCLGDWRRAVAVLFERHSLSGHPAPRREAGAGIAEGAVSRALSRVGGGDDPGANKGAPVIIAGTLPADYGKQGGNGMGEMEHGLIAHSLRADGFDASEDGTGRGTPLIPIDLRCTSRGEKMTNNRGPDAASGGPAGTGVGKEGDPAFTVSERGQAVAIPFDTTQMTSKANEVSSVREDQRTGAIYEMPYTSALASQGGGKPGQGYQAVRQGMAVRRLTPRECERLQGFPDDYTLIPYRGKPAADGPRYKALGNSMAVPCMAWIGKRIALVDAIPRSEECAA